MALSMMDFSGSLSAINNNIHLKLKQREFLEYVQKNHQGVGYHRMIGHVLDTGTYNKTYMQYVLDQWELLVDDFELFNEVNDTCHNNPIQYRNIK